MSSTYKFMGQAVVNPPASQQNTASSPMAALAATDAIPTKFNLDTNKPVEPQQESSSGTPVPKLRSSNTPANVRRIEPATPTKTDDTTPVPVPKPVDLVNINPVPNIDDESIQYQGDITEQSVIDTIYSDADSDDTDNTPFDDLDRFEKTAVAVPLGTATEMQKVYERDIELSEAVPPESDINSAVVDQSIRNLTNAVTALTHALEKVNPKTNKTASETLVDNADGVTTTGVADIFGMYKDQQSALNLSGKYGYLTLMGLSGTIRRINLIASGLQLQIHAPTIDQMITYQRELTQLVGYYGRTIGAPYYTFADAQITEYIINQFLPKLFVKSNYIDSTNWDAVKERIMYQDYQTIMAVLVSLIYPNGVKASFACSNPECRHVETLNFDMSKLLLINRDLLSSEAIAHLHRKNKIDDAQLAEYHKVLGLERSIEIEYDINKDVHKHWTVELRQCTLGQYIRAAKTFMDELALTKVKDLDDAQTRLLVAATRMIKPWISKITGHFTNNGKTLNAELINDDSDAYTSMGINTILDEWHLYYPQIRDIVTNYILETKIPHVAFYYPKCPVCGTKTSSGYGGYVPYDAQAGFFTLTQLQIMSSISQNSNDTTNS